jgi:cysteinyl-tRNA synthetase
MIQFYNTQSRKKEEFIPKYSNKVTVYSCGPTVYSHQHIGNMRAMIFVDVLKRVLRYFNYNVEDVINITDVGHLVSDGDTGEDKMLKAAKKEQLDPYQIAKKYEDIFVNDLKKLHIVLPKHMPRATEHIKEQIDIIKELEQNGYTYVTDDGVYFDVEKFKEYGSLSKQSLKDKLEGARVEKNANKKSPFDFVLWKFLVGENKHHIMKWDSPWGIGFPGWHIECSAMSSKYLGDDIDIHTGGIEHIPVHHENEIAQNKCSHNIKVHYWLHNDHLMVEGEKMSKSLGNIYTISDLEKKGYSPLAFREMCLRSHYRKNMNFTFDSLEAGEINVKKINEFKQRFNSFEPNTTTSSISSIYNTYLDKFENALKDDLNTPEALAAVHEFMNQVNKVKQYSQEDIDQILEFIEKTNSVLGLVETEIIIPNDVLELARKRKEARDHRNFELADTLREEIKQKGYEIKDDKHSKQGFILTKL